MNNAQRAKIFAPYAALKGFGDYIRSAERTTEERVLLAEDAAAELNARLQRVRRGDIIRVRYYLRDRYVEICGAAGKISLEEEWLAVGGVKIPIADILALEGEDV